MLQLMTRLKGNNTSGQVSALCDLSLKYPWEISGGRVINWGSTVGPKESTSYMANLPEAVSRSVNKRATLEFLRKKNIRTIIFTTSLGKARQWWEDGRTVYCRTLTAGHAGAGIVLARKADGVRVRRAPLYSRFTKCAHEVRVLSSLYEDVEDVVLVKRRMRAPELATLGLEKANYWIRTHENGWVFCSPHEANTDQRRSNQAKRIAKKVLSALGLHFGAVDMQTSIVDGEFRYRIIEVNSAPAIERTDSREWVTSLVNVIR